MSIGPISALPGSAAGAPLAQAKGSQAEAAIDEAGHERQLQTDRSAENAAGIGEMAQDQEASDRDADGRRIWEITGKKRPSVDEPEASEDRQSKDATGESGNALDLSG